MYDALIVVNAIDAVPTNIEAVCAFCIKLAVSTFDAFCANKAYDAVVANEELNTVIEAV